MKDRVALILTACTAALHLAVANRYDTLRDELYFVICGRHPDFGYADQPPLVPLLAASFDALGHHTWIIRLPAIAAAAGLVYLVVRFVRLLGGGDAAACTAALCAAAAPVLAGITATINTTTLEPLAWTLVAYAIARALVRDDRHSLVWGGAVAGLAMEAKYAIALWMIALAIGLAATPERRVFARRELWIGIALAVAIAVPSVVWQAQHGWPFAELIRNAGVKNTHSSPLVYAFNQVFILGPAFAPVWIAGLVGPFRMRELRPMRFLAIAYAVAAIATISGGGKDYYLAPAYPPLMAAGGIALMRVIRTPRRRLFYLGAATAGTALGLPLALPILSPPALVTYQRVLHLTPQTQERIDTSTLLPPLFGDMLGWHDFVREVAQAWSRIRPAERARTSILVDNYGEAAAIDYYGGVYGLPPALSGHNQYWYWGLRGQSPRNLLLVQNNPARPRPYCTATTLLGTTKSLYARSFENGKAIVYCRGLKISLKREWIHARVMI